MRKTLAPLLALAALLLLPSLAAAETIVPPGNSAAAQYTESLPTAKGERDSQGPKKKNVTPGKVLGDETAKKLEAQGPEGEAVANFAAETAPEASAETAGSEAASGGKQGGNGNGGAKGKGDKGSGGAKGGSKAGQGKPGAGGQGTEEETEKEAATAPATGSGGSGGGPSGSSAVGEVASQATGVSSGELGLWLPIVLVAVLAWAGFYAWRRRTDGSERVV